MSAGVLLLNERAEILLCHATETDHWDIPKGMADPGELPRDAALRELWEETGLVLAGAGLSDLGVYAYRSDKSLHLFAQRVASEDIDIGACICTSLFPSRRNGRMIPEMDEFAWIALDAVPRYTGRNMARVLRDDVKLRDLYRRLA
ncbi:NUDIX hydrolase [Robbsia sp. KACC 23696]|uniref:NUDIX hydrolase n=1 Tax=Robbsia sp. KACC 23696 TaxID=3149231 RepID=UPI00325A7259